MIRSWHRMSNGGDIVELEPRRCKLMAERVCYDLDCVLVCKRRLATIVKDGKDGTKPRVRVRHRSRFV